MCISLDNGGQSVVGGRLHRSHIELPENSPVPGAADTRQDMHSHRGRRRRRHVFSLKIRDFGFQPVGAREYRRIAADCAQVGAGVKLLKHEVLQHVAERPAPARVGEIIQTPIRIKHRNAIRLQTGTQLRLEDRQIEWHGPARRGEYLRTFRKPKTVFFPPELRMHHGSSVGDDERILTKINNYGHKDGIDPDWFERVWKNFSPSMRNFHYFRQGAHLYESIDVIPRTELPAEITRWAWPDGWIE